MKYAEFNERLALLNKTTRLENRMVPRLIAISGKTKPGYLSLKRPSGSAETNIDINLTREGYMETHFERLYQENSEVRNYAAKLANLCMQFAMTPSEERFEWAKDNG